MPRKCILAAGELVTKPARYGLLLVPRRRQAADFARLLIDRERNAVDDLEPVPGQVGQTRLSIGHDDHFAHADIAQNLRSDPVLTEIRIRRIEVGTDVGARTIARSIAV